MGTERRRLGGAFGVSLAFHVALALTVIVLMGVRPTPASSSEPPIPLNVVYLPATDSGGGGGASPGGASPRLVTIARHVPPESPPTEPEPLKPEPERVPPTLDATVASTADMLQWAGRLGVTLSPGGGGPGQGLGPASGPGLGPGGSGHSGGGPPGPRGDITPPEPIVEVQPRYTTAAMVAKIQGSVRLSVVVRADGSVGDVRILQSLDAQYGLDEQAVKAARAWRFNPGRRLGAPVDVLVTIILDFRLH